MLEADAHTHAVLRSLAQKGSYGKTLDHTPEQEWAKEVMSATEPDSYNWITHGKERAKHFRALSDPSLFNHSSLSYIPCMHSQTQSLLPRSLKTVFTQSIQQYLDLLSNLLTPTSSLINIFNRVLFSILCMCQNLSTRWSAPCQTHALLFQFAALVYTDKRHKWLEKIAATFHQR